MNSGPPRQRTQRPATTQRTLLGFDYGLTRIGVAVGQEITAGTQPLRNVTARDGEPDWAIITQLIHTWEPDALVVGVPLHMDGAEQPITAGARRFARRLEGRYRLAVHQVDERLSSDEAQRRLAARGIRGRGVKEYIDPVAACLILETWFNQRGLSDDRAPNS
ncbi:MAG: Holliday junction resolvase RuvX [Chromatiales bacterium 21-64-14]|nr:MAG: Holliday junction resolvase RuvX [Chromatiales bacterium 21-64-14]HQU15773.1 Holliday junction resolvase RuvX [Gammaproteobacteria bacterium]